MAIYVRRDGVSFYGLAFSHPESNIPGSVDVLVTHEPPLAILHGIEGTNWGNLPLLKRIYDVKPKFHLFGHILNLEQEPTIIKIYRISNTLFILPQFCRRSIYLC